MEVDKVGIHLSHCCKTHGCKYGHDDCPVEFGGQQQEFPCEICPKWSLKWPEEEEGYYWFYGFTSRLSSAFSDTPVPRLDIVDVRLAGSGENRHWCYVRGGAFMYKSEGGVGYWLPMEQPDLPALPVPLPEKR